MPISGYIKHVLSVLWQLIRPSALARLVASILPGSDRLSPRSPRLTPVPRRRNRCSRSLMVGESGTAVSCPARHLATRRAGHLFRHQLPCVSANSSDQAGLLAAAATRCRQHDGSFAARRHHHSRPRAAPSSSTRCCFSSFSRYICLYPPGIRRSCSEPWLVSSAGGYLQSAPRSEDSAPTRSLFRDSPVPEQSILSLPRAWSFGFPLLQMNGSPLLTWRSGGMSVSIWPALRPSYGPAIDGSEPIHIVPHTESKAFRSAGFNGIAGVTFQSMQST